MADGSSLFSAGNAVRILDGPWEDKPAVIQSVDESVSRVLLVFEHFERMVPCEIEFHQLQPLDAGEEAESIGRIRAHLAGDA